MLQITPEQLSLFARKNEQRFVEQLTAGAAAAYPELVWMKGRDGLRQMVERYLEVGKSHGLSYQYTLARYTYWRLDHGDGIETGTEWEFLRTILQDDTLAEEEKIFEIDTLLYGAPLYPESWDYE
jgi:hypothetical protein